MTRKYSQLGAGSILGCSPQAETLFPQSTEDGNNSFLKKMGANSKVALATGVFAALFAVNSAAKTIYSEVDEDIGVVEIGIKMECLSGVPNSASISYSSSDGTATASSSDSDGDYTAVDGVLTWDGDASDCDVTKYFELPILDDSIAEGNETINFTFSNGDTAVLTILDNEPPVTPPTFDFSQSSYSLDEDAGVATIGVTISCPSGDNPDSASVSYSSSDGTAASDDDYTAVNGVLTWDANDCKTTQTFEVSIQDDSEAEDNETVNLSLDNGNTAELTIVDNDTPVTPPPVVDPQPLLPTFEFSQSSYSVDEGAGVATIEVTINCPSGDNPDSVSVSYNSSDGGMATAGSDGDYTAVDGVLTWEANDCDTTQTFEVSIQDDSEFEKDEMLNLSLDNGNTAILTIIDNDAQDNQPPVVEPQPVQDEPKVEDDEPVDLELDNGNTAEINDVPPTPVYSSGGGGGTSEMPTSIPDGGFSQNWNAGGQSLTDDIEIGESGSMTNAVIESQVINHGWVYSSHIEMGASISGGIVSGLMTVEGSLTNFEFRGASINGRNEAGEIVGMLGGTIINNSKVGGYFEDVLLAPNTSIFGGGLRNQIIGDANRPALLRNLKVWPGSKLDNVIIGPGVKLPKKVSLGIGVQIATQSFSIDSLGNSIATETYSVETIRTSMKRQHNGVRLSQSVASSVQIKSRMFVDSKHIGQAAERITVAYHQTSTTTTSYMCTGGSNWQVWDGEMGNLEAAEQYDSLPEDMEVPIFEGDLSELPGDFTVHNGYRLEDDSSITYNGDAPTQFSIVVGDDEPADDDDTTGGDDTTGDDDDDTTGGDDATGDDDDDTTGGDDTTGDDDDDTTGGDDATGDDDDDTTGGDD
ncbi:MAG: hypothetical protein DRQ41_08190, partial [Gammaproteobacteria bacterium]